MKILGIDPGVERVGWGIITIDHSLFNILGYGCIKTPRNLPQSARILLINNELSGIIKCNNPDRLSIEKIFFSKNTKTAIAVAEARGSILLTAAANGLDIMEFTPSEIKLGITGNGRAEKRQVAWMAQKILDFKDDNIYDDTMDALALCIVGSKNA